MSAAIEHYPRRYVLRALGIIVVLICVFGALAFDTAKVASLSSRANHLAQGIKRSIQTSRYDAAYRNCVTTNESHRELFKFAKPYETPNDQGQEILLQAFSIVLPLRNGLKGTQTCAQYAQQQTSLDVPPNSTPSSRTAPIPSP